MSHDQPLEELHAAETQRDQFKARAERLWQLLDNIDTLDDSCRDNDAAFRREARKQQKQRFEIAVSYDGQTLTWKEKNT